MIDKNKRRIEMKTAIKILCDFILILVWMYIISTGETYNAWLVLISLLFWFSGYSTSGGE